jgi:hypothetical protein
MILATAVLTTLVVLAIAALSGGDGSPKAAAVPAPAPADAPLNRQIEQLGRIVDHVLDENAR